METAVKCQLRDCKYNKNGYCIKKVITLLKLDHFKPYSEGLRCDDYKTKW